MRVGKLTDIRMEVPEETEYAIVMDIWDLEDFSEVLNEVINYGGLFDTDKIKHVQEGLKKYLEELSK